MNEKSPIETCLTILSNIGRHDLTKSAREELAALKANLAIAESRERQMGLALRPFSLHLTPDDLEGGETFSILTSSEELRAVHEALKGKPCTCGEPHISDRIQHCYDGKPCYVKP